ncbi:MAG: hypothetical protein E6K31_03860 [Gammaproteobacteria bacterium]|nr:MAG: hypothetical protein E6K31_03860 [Gammaproteobacteria bacterium]
MNARARLGIRSLLGRRERGMALITSLLLLLIVTILALSMFRGFVAAAGEQRRHRLRDVLSSIAQREPRPG